MGRTPTVDEMKSFVRDLFENAYENFNGIEVYEGSSGGFCVQIWPNASGEGSPSLYLSFVLRDEGYHPYS